MTPARLWPIAIVGVLGVTVAANVVLLVAAGDPKSGGMEPDYYRRALAWDSTMAEARHNEALGWRLEARLGQAIPAGWPLMVRLTDPDGLAIPEAAISVEAIHNRDPLRPVRARLDGGAGGDYRVVLPLTHRGLWELRFAAERHGERFTARLRLDTERPSP
jgi:nitrogen fixation protein FixH